MHLLTVDLGNSRCKLRLWSAAPGSEPRLEAGADLDTREDLPARAAEWLARNPGAGAGALCSVAGSALEAALRRALGGILLERLDAGLGIACRASELVGPDRLFAARAAFELAGGAALVVDAGTALTVDAVGEGGVFLGGAIAPGPRLLSESLSRSTARLPRVEPRPGAPALGRDTREALEGGIAVGFRGAARELVLRVGEEAGLASAPVFVTGGAGAFLLALPSLFPGRRLRAEPELVHLGLLAALRGAIPSR